MHYPLGFWLTAQLRAESQDTVSTPGLPGQLMAPWPSTKCPANPSECRGFPGVPASV